MNLQLMLPVRYLQRRRMRTFLTTLAIVFGVAIIFGMQGLVPAIRASVSASVVESAHQVDLIITHETGGLFDQRVVEQVERVPGIAAASPVLERSLLLPGEFALPATDGNRIDALHVNGVAPEIASGIIPIKPVAGRWIGPDDTNALMVRESLPRRTGLDLGDSIHLPSSTGTTTYTIVGVLPERPVLGDEEIFMALSEAQELFNLHGRINAIVAQFAPGADGGQVNQAAADTLGPGYTLGAIEAGADEWATALRMADVVFTMFGVLALAMGGFIMFNTFRTSVAERKRDIGMLRAVGAPRRTVLSLVLAEGLVQGVAGTIGGMLLGYLLVQVLISLLNPTWEQYFSAPLGAPSFGLLTFALSVGLGVAVPLLSGLYPALAASRVTPLEALRPAPERADRRTARGQAGAGGGLVALALLGLASGHLALASLGAVLFLIGMIVLTPVLLRPLLAALGRVLLALFAGEGRLAQSNLLRQVGRSSVTLSTIMISMAILVALAGLAITFTDGLMGYLDRSMRANYLLVPEALVLGSAGNLGAGPAFAERVRNTPGIAEVTTIRRSETTIGGLAVQVLGIDPTTYPDVAGLVFAAGNADAAYAHLGSGRAVIVNGILAARAGIEVGQERTLQTVAGPRMYEVVAIGVDYLNSRVPSAYISHANLADDFGETSDVMLMANREAGAAPGRVEAELLAITRDYPAFSLFSFEQWRAMQLEGNQTRTRIMYALMALLAIPSLIALANTLGISVIERTREIGMLRAIGASRAQVQRMIVAESVLLAVLGVGFGILGGVMLGYVLVDVVNAGGLIMRYFFPYSGIALAIAIGLVFGILAALLPARHAARLDVIAALRYE